MRATRPGPARPDPTLALIGRSAVSGCHFFGYFLDMHTFPFVDFKLYFLCFGYSPIPVHWCVYRVFRFPISRLSLFVNFAYTVGRVGKDAFKRVGLFGALYRLLPVCRYTSISRTYLVNWSARHRQNARLFIGFCLIAVCAHTDVVFDPALVF